VMESQGVVARRELETSPPSVEYNLTAVGAQLVPVVHLLLDVGLKLKGQREKSRREHLEAAPN